MSLNDTITALGTSIINLVDRKTPIATTSTVGMVKPDGSTINIDANGVISSNGGGARNTNAITNCITEIPQNIKLELNNGTLTLKAGSKVYVPNGFESDGTTPKFDEVTIESDLISSQRNYDLTNVMFVENNVLTPRRNDFISSGSTAPSSPLNGWIWYDTTNNIIKYYNGSTWTTDNNISFPLAIVKSTVSSSYTSIDQTFNGFGYIGSTVFALPGVKGLAPNGRNEDGTLKNIEYALSRVWTMDGYTAPYIINAYGGINPCFWTNYAAQDTQPSFSNGDWYNTLTNECYKINDNVPTLSPSFIVGNAVVNNGNVVSFTPKKPLQLVNYSDLTDCHVVVETYQNGASWYRVWSDGWCEQGGVINTTSAGGSQTINLLVPYKDTNYGFVKSACFIATSNTYVAYATGYHSKTNSTVTAYFFKSSEANYYNWQAYGYIS